MSNEPSKKNGGTTYNAVPEKKWRGFRLMVVLVWGLVVGGLVLWQAFPYLVGALGGLSMTKAFVNKPQGFFYRFNANFSHKGEKLNFDYVVACNIRVTVYRGGDRSDDSFYSPKVMMMPTSDGGAVLLRTIDACKGQTTANGEVPADLFPMAIWFDDVNDMTFGWGYATEDAYENELSQLEFHEATIEAASREDWDAWREASAKDFKPTGMITTPWGWSYSGPENQRYGGQRYDASRRLIARNCHGYARVRLPENVRANIRYHWPEHRPRYWSPPETVNMRSILDKGEYPDGKKHRNYLTSDLGSGYRGLPRRNGGGTIGNWRSVVSDVYPELPRSRSTTQVIDSPTDTYPRRVLYDNGRMKGFLACGGDAHVDVALSDLDWDFRSKKHPIYMDGYQALEDYNPLSRPSYIFDRDEYVFLINPAGRGSP